MAESSENWNIEIIPGARRVRQATAFVKRIAMLGTQTELCLSGHIVDRVDTGAAAMLDTALDEPEQLRIPGEIGSVAVLDYRARANDIIN